VRAGWLLLKGGRWRHHWPNPPWWPRAGWAMLVLGGAGIPAAPAVRAHLPSPPPLPDHRGLRGDPDAPGRRLPVRVHEATRAEGSHVRRRVTARARASTGM